jgi:hypothetical protein
VTMLRCLSAFTSLHWPRLYGPRPIVPLLRSLPLPRPLMVLRTCRRPLRLLWPRCLTSWPLLPAAAAWLLCVLGGGFRRRRRRPPPAKRTAVDLGFCRGLKNKGGEKSILPAKPIGRASATSQGVFADRFAGSCAAWPIAEVMPPAGNRDRDSGRGRRVGKRG